VRVRELNCLYGISGLAGQQDISLEGILQETVKLIPPAFRYPGITCARISLDGQEFKTANFEESPWQQRADIVVHARRAGGVEVRYLEQRPERDEGPFVTEEIDLLNAIAERLGRISERKQAEHALRRARDEMETLLDVSYDLSTVPELPDLVDLLLRHLRKVVSFQRAEVMLVDDEGVLTTHAFYALVRPPDVTTARIPVSAVPAFQRIFDRREAVYAPDIQADEAALEAFGRVVSEPWLTAMAEMRTWLGVPLKVRDRVLGILSLLHTEPDCYDPSTQNLLKVFANQLAIAIENTRLYAGAQEMAVFEERTRLARELHDSVTQTLYSTNLFADATSLALSADNIDAATDHLDSLRDLIWQAMLEMRMLTSAWRESDNCRPTRRLNCTMWCWRR
jgi:GAF domain-containing protein